MQAWLRSHNRAFIYSLKQYYRHLYGNILIAMVIGFCIALPSSLYLILENAQQITSDWDDTLNINAFLKHGTDDTTAIDIIHRLLKNPNIKTAELITQEKALLEYKELSGFAEIIDLLDENPLPSVIIITPTIDIDKDHSVIDFIQAQPEIELLQHDQQWLERLRSIITIIHRCTIIFCILTAIGVLLIVGNTIHMAIHVHRQEIEIIRIFGATNQFVQRPFLYSGLWYGLSGGISAWCLIIAIFSFLEQPINQLSAAYTGKFSLTGLSIETNLIIFSCSTLLGLIGSWISVKYHLRNLSKL